MYQDTLPTFLFHTVRTGVPVKQPYVARAKKRTGRFGNTKKAARRRPAQNDLILPKWPEKLEAWMKGRGY